MLREPSLADERNFLTAMERSQKLHQPWVRPPHTSEEFRNYIDRYKQDNHASFLVINQETEIVGVFNLNEIVRGFFQSAYLGFYAVANYTNKGYMSAGLKLILKMAFEKMSLHRVEANIQPGNIPSINLVKHNGFKKEGFSPKYLKINGEWRDHERWAMIYEDWK